MHAVLSDSLGYSGVLDQMWWQLEPSWGPILTWTGSWSRYSCCHCRCR